MKKYKKIYIEITNVCNLKCDFCPETNRKSAFLKVDEFSNILDQIKPFTDYIYLHVKGEPLLHPDLFNFLDIAYSKGFKVNITTNGTLINESGEALLNKPGLRQINFSLHSFDGNEKSELTKEEYINNIISFTKKANELTNMFISLRLWNLETNKDSLKNLDILSTLEQEFKLVSSIAEHIDEGRGIRLKDRVFLNHSLKFDWPDLSAEEDFSNGFCYGLKDQIAILVDGTVVPCCLDNNGTMNLGNIFNTNFSNIITSERAMKISDGFSKHKVVEELCRKCGYRKQFN